MKYLELTLNETWSFGLQFKKINNKGREIIAALSRIMPNLGRPDESRRKLYVNALHSVMAPC